jgi:anti-sigma regulatory factor (Ser/Thr protein kinase)
LQVRDEPYATHEVRSAVERAAALRGLSNEACFDLKLAATEALTNALRLTPDGATVDVVIIAQDNAIEIEVRNSGPMPNGSPERAFSPEYGRGIPLMLALVDEVQFASTGSGTLVRIRKNVP